MQRQTQVRDHTDRLLQGVAPPAFRREYLALFVACKGAGRPGGWHLSARWSLSTSPQVLNSAYGNNTLQVPLGAGMAGRWKRPALSFRKPPQTSSRLEMLDIEVGSLSAFIGQGRFTSLTPSSCIVLWTALALSEVRLQNGIVQAQHGRG